MNPGSPPAQRLAAAGLLVAASSSLLLIASALQGDLGGGQAGPWPSRLAGALLVTSGLWLGLSYRLHPTSGVWSGSLALMVGCCLALVWADGARSPLLPALPLLCALSGLAHARWSGLALALGVALVGGLLGIEPLSGAGVEPFGWRVALVASGGLGLLFLPEEKRSRQGRPALAPALSSRLEEAYALVRAQTREREAQEVELRDKQRKLSAILAGCQRLLSVRDAGELLDGVLQSARAELDAGVALVFLWEGGRLSLEGSAGLSEAGLEWLRRDAQAGPLGGVGVGVDGLRWSERQGWEPGLGFPGPPDGLRSLVAVPMRTPLDGAPLGILAVANHRVGEEFSGDQEDCLRIFATHAAISLKNLRLVEQLERSCRELIQVLAQAIEAKDPCTHGHVGRVRREATRLARALGLSQAEVARVAQAATLHDVGKIGVPDAILNKQGPLSPEESEIMRRHAQDAAGILGDIQTLSPSILEMVVHHHERHDGGGYPAGLSGDQIPIGARIIGVVDAFDAMISDRPYRKGLEVPEALARLEQGRGSQFDPRILDAFLRLHGGPPRATGGRVGRLEIETRGVSSSRGPEGLPKLGGRS